MGNFFELLAITTKPSLDWIGSNHQLKPFNNNGEKAPQSYTPPANGASKRWSASARPRFPLGLLWGFGAFGVRSILARLLGAGCWRRFSFSPLLLLNGGGKEYTK